MINETFRTVIKPVLYDFKISYKTKMMFIGSCFTENIGRKLEEQKFDIKVNPFGIVYNPISVSDELDMISEEKYFTDKDLINYDGYFHSLYHHGKFSGRDKSDVLENINNEINKSHKFLKETDVIFLTFGTSWVYEYIERKQIAANCHKIPSNYFNKRLLSVNEIFLHFKKTIKKLRKINSDLKIFFSVSPVRHLKDGFSENFLSKSILRVAIEKLSVFFSEIYYFPSYEILTDDLRDYRFYDKDLVHPNETASDYIYDFFGKTFFSGDTIKISEKIKKILKAKNHRFFDIDSQQTKDFVSKQLKEIEVIEKDCPYINMNDEKEYFLNIK